MISAKRVNRPSLAIIASIFTILAATWTIPAAAATAATHYKFGIFPFMPMAGMLKYYNSVSADFTKLLNKRVIAQTRPTFKQFSEELENETYDIVFVQPFDYPKAYAHHYKPLAKRSDTLDTILVTRSASDIHTIADLKGKTIASPPLESAISQIMQKEFSKAELSGTNAVKIIYTRNHFACIQMVLVSKAVACGTTTPVLDNWQNSQLKKKKLRIIHRTNGIPHALYMVHDRVPDADKAKIKNAILTWHKRPAGKMILKMFSLTKFVEAKDSDYDVIRTFWQ